MAELLLPMEDETICLVACWIWKKNKKIFRFKRERAEYEAGGEIRWKPAGFLANAVTTDRDLKIRGAKLLMNVWIRPSWSVTNG
jgi:hypothetical protein